MRALKLAVAAAVLGLGAPLYAQSTGYEGAAFVDAVRKGDNNKALELLGSRPNLVDARDGAGDTALIASIAERSTNWTAHLLKAGADPNRANNRSGDTPLIVAARIGNEQAVDWLLSLGAKVNEGNRRGETPLIVAVQQRQRDIVASLLKAGADPNKADSAAGYSALDYAKRDTRSRDILSLIEKSKKPATATLKF